MKRAALLLATFSLFGISCERHSWEETKGLHKHGGGEKHATGGEHGKTDAHAEPAKESKPGGSH